MARREEETMRSQGFWVRELRHVICVLGKMEEVAVSGKMMNSISDTLGLEKM